MKYRKIITISIIFIISPLIAINQLYFQKYKSDSFPGLDVQASYVRDGMLIKMSGMHIGHFGYIGDILIGRSDHCISINIYRDFFDESRGSQLDLEIFTKEKSDCIVFGHNKKIVWTNKKIFH